MNEATYLVITGLSLLLALATVIGYERALRRANAERDEAVADADLFSELLIEQAKHRHPSGSNVRVLRVVEGG